MAGPETERKEGSNLFVVGCVRTDGGEKVDVSVNGQTIPFDMKIGEAGEAFFVFETDEDVPEELITSPILQPTQPGHVGAPDVQTDRFGPRPVEGDEPGKDAGDLVDTTAGNQEPEFLDLNAEGPPSSSEISGGAGRIALSLPPEAVQSPLLPPPTPSIGPGELLGWGYTGPTSPSRQVDEGTKALVGSAPTPKIIFTDGNVFLSVP